MSDGSLLPPGMEADRATPSSSVWKLVVLLGIGCILLAIVHLSPQSHELRDLRVWQDRLDGGGIINELRFFAAASLFIAVGVPRLLFFVLAGLAFGLVEGFSAAMAASVIGSWLTFKVLRWAGAARIRAYLQRRAMLRRVVDVRPTVFSVFLVRQLPISGIIITASLALSKVRSRTFLAGSALGFLPQGIVATLIGAGVGDDVALEGIAQLVMAAMLLLGLTYWARWRAKARAVAAELSVDC